MDGGVYKLLCGEHVTATRHDYVPNCIPGKYGDYVVFDIAEDGTLKGWKPDACDIQEAFFPVDE